jgi:hypothetical protein
MVAGGALLLAVGIVVGGATMWAWVSGKDFQKVKPGWWLVREIDSADAATAVTAARELSVRVTAGTLAQSQVDAAVDKILGIQAKPNAKWDAAFGDFVEDARLAKKLSDERFGQYATQGPSFGFEARPSVNAGDVLPFWIRNTTPRVGSRRTLRSDYTASFQVDDFDVAMPYAVTDQQLLAMTLGGGATGANVDLKKYADRLPVGRHELHAVLTVRMALANAPAGATPFVWTKQKLTAAFDVVPAEVLTVKVVDDESIHAVMEANVGVSGAEYGRIAKDALDFRADVKSIPVGVGYDVFVVTADGKRHRAGTIASRSRGANSTSSSLMRATVKGFAADAVDFVFVPSVDAAKRTTDVFEVWNGEITKRGVPVKFTSPQPAPATAATTKPAT